MTVVAYARIGVQDQDQGAQLQALQSHGYDRIFTDQPSPHDRNRPQLKLAIASLRSGDILVFWRLDRLARSFSHLGEIAEACQHKRAHLKCLTQPVNTITNRTIYPVIAAFAEFERSAIFERTIAGLEAARASGKKCGRPKGMKMKRVLTPGNQANV